MILLRSAIEGKATPLEILFSYTDENQVVDYKLLEEDIRALRRYTEITATEIREIDIGIEGKSEIDSFLDFLDDFVKRTIGKQEEKQRLPSLYEKEHEEYLS